MDCLHCGKKLSMVKKLTTGEFCSAAHKKAYLQEQEKSALARLLENQDRLVGKAPVPEKKDLLEVEREAARARAAKRALRSKTKPQESLPDSAVPAEGEFLPEAVTASEGPKYLALPDSQVALHVDPVLPEFGAAMTGVLSADVALDGAKSSGEANQEDSPFVSVTSRFGLEAIFGVSPDTELHAEYLGIPEFAPYSLEAKTASAGSGEVLGWASAVSRPMAELHVGSDWHQVPAQRASDEWERAIDQLSEAEPCKEDDFDFPASISAKPAGDGSNLEPFGPKRFAFSRLPELSSPQFSGSLWEAAAAVPWNAVADVQLSDECLVTTSFLAFEPSAPSVPTGYGQQNWRKRGSVHEPAEPVVWDAMGKLRSADPQGTLKLEAHGKHWQLGEIGLAAALPGSAQSRFDEALLRFEGDGLGALYEPLALSARPPRGPYDLSEGNRFFPPPPRIASVPRAASPSAHPPKVTKLAAIEIPSGCGAATQVRLRAHGEVSLTRGNIFLPKIKHKIRPVILDDSFYAALGQLTAGNRDFSIAGLKKHWNLAPNDIRWVAMAIPIVLGLVWYSSSGGGAAPESVASHGSTTRVENGAPTQPSEPGIIAKLFGDDSMVEMKRSIQKRAAVELSDDFRQGLGDWSGVGDWARGWSYDRAGFLRPRQIAFYTPSMELTDYRLEFLGQIERKALSWVFRAADPRNYYVNRLEITGPGPLPVVVLVRYAVIGGVAGAKTVTRLPMQTQMDTLYRVRVDVQGSNFVTTIQGQVVDVFSDDKIARGGVGFFAGPGEDVRLRWVEVSHQYDFLGRLCAFLVPYNVSK